MWELAIAVVVGIIFGAICVLAGIFVGYGLAQAMRKSIEQGFNYD